MSSLMMPVSGTAAGASADAIYDRLALALIGAVTLVSLLVFRDYGLSWDDYTHSEYGDLLLAWYGSGFTDRRVFDFVNLYRYGGGFDMAAALAAKALPFGLFETRRLAGAIVGILGMIATWRVGRRIGGPRAGVVTLALLAACPLYIGHMFMNPKDAPFAAAMALLLLGLIRIVEDYPRPSVASLIIFGLGLGFGVGTRVLAGFEAFSAAAALILLAAIDWRAHGFGRALAPLGLFLARLIPAFVLAYGVMALIWPWSVIDPLNPWRAVVYFREFFEQPWKELFAGNLILVPDMPASYVPVLMALRLPEIFLALAAAGFVFALAVTCRASASANRRAVLLMVAIAATLPIVVTMTTRPAMYNGLRHFVFVLPPMAALGGLAADKIARWLGTKGRWALGAGGALLLAGLASPVVEMARLHPYEYTHFNRLAGGVSGARGRYMLDYWGLSLTQAARALSAHIEAKHEAPPAGQWRIAVCGPHRPVQVVFGQDRIVTTWDPRGADFAVTLAEYYCAPLAAPVIAEIIRDGVVFARAYDLRGTHIPSLLTVPGLEDK